MDTEKMNEQLMARLAENYADYNAVLLTKDRQELIDDAENIAHVQSAYEDIMGNHAFSESQLNHFLKFQNPLEVIAAHWPDIPAVGSEAELKRYPLVSDAQPSKPLHKFMNVDVIQSLQAIMGQVIVHFQSDFQYDKESILKAVSSDNPEKKNLVWLCRTSGTHMHQERDVFIKDTASHNNIQFYHRDCKSEQAVIYSIELTGMKNGVVRGNLYERDRHQFAELAFRGASPHIGETLTFSSGQELYLSREEFNNSYQPNLEYEHGKLMEVRHEAEDETVVQGAIQREHERRDGLPKGSIKSHVGKMADQRVQAEADRIQGAFANLTEPNSPNKTHMMVPLSEEFLFLSSSRDTEVLLDKLGAVLKNDTLHLSGLKSEKGVYCFIKPQKQSIKEQLAASQTAITPPVPGDKPIFKHREER